MIFIEKFYKTFFPVVTVLMTLLTASSHAGPDDEFLNWRNRPSSLQHSIDWNFEKLETQGTSAWGIYNGALSYDILSVDESKFALKLIHEANLEGRTDVWFLDVGAGNFQLGDSLAKQLQLSREIPSDRHVHIIGIRGESYSGKEITTTGQFTVYKFGGFKIENLEDEFTRRNLNLTGKIDFIFSRWSMRHLTDPLGTWVQLYDLLLPKMGFMMMDWFYYLEGNENLSSKVDAFWNQRLHLLKLLNFIGDPFLLRKNGDPSAKQTDQFVLQKKRSSPLKLPLVYESGESCDGLLLDIGSHEITRFKVIGSDLLKKPPLYDLIDPSPDLSSLYGDVNLFLWFKINKLGYTFSVYNTFDQLFFLNETQALVPLYSQEEIMKKREIEREEKDNEKRKNEQRKKVKTSVLNELKLTQRETPSHPYFEAEHLEHKLFSALRGGDFVSAQSTIDQGAEIERRFYFGSRPETLLSYACKSEFPNGAIAFLLKNKASIKTACLDNALLFRSEDEVFSLLAAGVNIEDPVLALARSVGRGHYKLVDYFVKNLGFDVNAFICGRPMIYMANHDDKMWNHLIDLGAKGCFREVLEKRGRVN